MATNSHSRWSTSPLQCHSESSWDDVYRQLTFSRHVALVGNNVKRQTGVLRKLASTSRGYDRQTLREIYIATGLSKVEYGTSSWLPWISNSTLQNLERSQRSARWAITVQLHTTPVEDILTEANLPSIKTRAIKLSTIAMKKSLRTQTNQRHTTVNQRAWRTKIT